MVNSLLCVGLCLHNAYIGISPRGARFYALPVDARKALPESGVARVFRAVLRTVMRADRSALQLAQSVRFEEI